MAISVFEIIDISFLVVLLGLLIFFLSKNRKGLSKEGILYLYKTSWGIKLIDKIGGKYKKTLHVLSYVSVFIGYILMAGILYLLGNTTFQYLTRPEIVETIRAPPIAPLIPYFPKLFGLSDFFPPLYAIYFIISILIVATFHEFSHGIFARRWGVNIKTTGFAFLRFFPVIFGAFVEQDDKQMVKIGKFKQMSILSAGVFANVLTAIIFFFISVGFFYLAFAPTGVFYNTYPYVIAESSSIAMINGVNVAAGISYEEKLNLMDDGLNKVGIPEGEFLITKENFIQQKDREKILLYYDAPAINANLEKVILKINGFETYKIEDLSREISKYYPGETITLTLISSHGDDYNRDLVLGENPETGEAWLGIGFISGEEQGFFKREMIHYITSLRQSQLNVVGNTYYEPLFGGASGFFYYLAWWIAMISILVALFNMLPVGILDGGRFFYLTILGITKSEKISQKVYGAFGYLILLIFLLLTFRWIISFL
jgi:membrane-associated protease RseP (regulator of RpoE activity)